MLKKTIALILVIDSIAMPVFAAAVPRVPGAYRAASGIAAVVPPPANALPDLKQVIQGAVVDDSERGSNRLKINQNMPRAILEWNRFDIGEKSTVEFSQKLNGESRKDWVALNRIYQLDPSRIFGALKADGSIYLINQNGILFGKGAQINVASLVVTSLNIKDSDFLAGSLKFKAENYINPDAPITTGPVVNRGNIEASELGSIFLMGPQVRNEGSITAPLGQAGLVSADAVELGTVTARQYLTVNPSYDLSVNAAAAADPKGWYAASNLSGGLISADTGLAGMYGRYVEQNGVIRSVTSIKKNGQIELHASNRVVLGPGSVTEVPVSASIETAHPSFNFQQGTIQIRGLDPDYPGVPLTGVDRIENYGTIRAPGGNVRLAAKERVYLKNGSLIDVSGVWVDKAASANRIEATLNSVNLRDDFGQKDGILKGQKIWFDAHLGSSIGDVSGYLSGEEKNALERSLNGGSITLTTRSREDAAGAGTATGDIVVKNGATLKFSGGGTRYAEGAFATTILYSGNSVYDIANAPQWVKYDRMGERTTYRSAHAEGADAGTLNIVGRQVALAGNLDGSSVRGIYQTGASELLYNGRQKTRGVKESAGGKLFIGFQPAEKTYATALDAVLANVVLRRSAPALSAAFTADTPLSQDSSLPAFTSVIDTSVLNSAGLGTLEIHANKLFRIDANAALSLIPGSSFTATARSILNQGSIAVPAGSVRLAIQDNLTSSQPLADGESPLNGRIYLSPGSSISVAGEIYDAGKLWADNRVVRTNGGTIALLDRTMSGEGVFVRRGALLDVSGGVRIDRSGSVSGGDAGSLKIQGNAIGLDGSIRGYALMGKNGGSLSLHALNVELVNSPVEMPDYFTEESALPSQLAGYLRLGGSLLDGSGFSRIALTSVNSLNVAGRENGGQGARLISSRIRYAVPAAGRLAALRTVQVADELAGSSSLQLKAGALFDRFDPDAVQPLDSRLNIGEGASVAALPGGSITATATGDVTINGTLSALGGKIAVSSARGNLTLGDAAVMEAKGYNRADLKPLTPYLPLGATPVSGGSVTLSAYNDLSIADGSSIDVSGSAPVTTYISTANGRVVGVNAASAAGDVSLIAGGVLSPNGSITARSILPNLRGGGLTLASSGTANPLLLKQAFLDRMIKGGFDAFTFRAAAGITFDGDISFAPRRSITLDAPFLRFTGTNQADVGMTSGWISLRNSALPWSAPLEQGKGRLTLAASWMDIQGDLGISGFSDVGLWAKRDIMLSDRRYDVGSTSTWSGQLRVPGNLSLTADRIYPVISPVNADDPKGDTTPGYFTLRADNNIWTRHSADSAGLSIPASAAGRLTLEAGNDLVHGGTLAAPLGGLTLKAGNRVYLDNGSRLLVNGDSPVAVGSVTDVSWKMIDKDNLNNLGGVEIKELKKSVNLTGKEIIVREKATIDVSGGGSAFGYSFVPGIQGSNNPFQKTGRFVVVPYGTVAVSSDAVFLEGVPGLLKAGRYAVLPERFAFLPGALVVTDLGRSIRPGERQATQEGYAIAAGYETSLGTTLEAPLYRTYEVRLASSVMGEGNFSDNMKTLSGRDGGSVSLDAPSTVVLGTVNAHAIADGKGGLMQLGGENITVQVASSNIDFSGFTPYSTLPESLRNRLNIAATSLSEGGFDELQIGMAEKTKSVTLVEGSRISAQSVSVSASEKITVEAGATIGGSGGGDATSGTVTLSSPDGLVTLDAKGAERGSIQAAKVNIEAAGLIINDTPESSGTLPIKATDTLSLTGKRLVIAASGSSVTEQGFTLDTGLLDRFASVPHLKLASRSDLVFLGDVTIKGDRELILDAARIAGGSGSGAQNVAVIAESLVLRNSSGTKASVQQAPVAGRSIKFETRQASGSRSATARDSILLDRADMVMDGFDRVALKTNGDLLLSGEGKLATAGNLDLTAARVAVTAAEGDAASPFQSGDYTVETGGVLTVSNSGGQAGTGTLPGGRLAMTAKSIEQGGVIEASSGSITLTATGKGKGDGVHLLAGGQLLARGGEYATARSGESVYTSGGSVVLQSASGDVAVADGALIDVSAAKQGDAGSVELRAAEGGVAINGSLMANAQADGAVGGSLLIDTNQVDDFSALNRTIDRGGFTNGIKLRTRRGDLVVAASDTVKARKVVMAADGGAIDIYGKVNASAADGGSVEMYAGKDLTVKDGGEINARATKDGGSGGDIFLSSAAGFLNLDKGSSLDVSGNGGRNGRVSLRAGRTADNSDVRMRLKGKVTGAREVVAEGVKVESYDANKSLGAGDFLAWSSSAQQFIANAFGTADDNGMTAVNRLTGGLTGVDAGAFHLRSGIEVQGTGDMALDAPLDLTSWRFNGEPGYLTLRAAGNLNINKNLIDAPTPISTLNSATAQDSWSYRLVAGSDLGGANPRGVHYLPATDAINPAAGGADLKVADGTFVYTEKGVVELAASRDLLVGRGGIQTAVRPKGLMLNQNIRFNVGSYSGRIDGVAGRDLVINNGALQTAVGDIGIRTGRDISLLYANDMGQPVSTTDSRYLSLGSIRTTGEASSPAGGSRYWEYANGGSIDLDARGDVTGMLTPNAWDAVYSTGVNRTDPKWSASFDANNATEGIATMAGGNLSVAAAGRFSGQAGTFGKGDLLVRAGKDLYGRFLVKQGRGSLRAMGNISKPKGSNSPLSIEAFDAKLDVLAGGSMEFGTVVNPTIANGAFSNPKNWNLGYGADSSLSLVTLAGDLTFTGEHRAGSYGLVDPNLLHILPPSLSMASGRDIHFNVSQLLLAPSSSANLTLNANGDIDGLWTNKEGGSGAAYIHMSEADPATVFGRHRFNSSADIIALYANSSHYAPFVKQRDTMPVEVKAGGNIRNLQLDLPKRAVIAAGNDISDIYLKGQNIAADDVTSIAAGRDLVFARKQSDYITIDNTIINRGIEMSGPGALLVTAGDNIDLGKTSGIQTLGNSYNSALDHKGSDILVSAGAVRTIDVKTARELFAALRAAGNEYNDLKRAGKKVEAQKVINDARARWVTALLGREPKEDWDKKGVLQMVSSQIKTNSGEDDIYILTAGDLNVGKTSFSSSSDAKSTGIYTAAGGDINILSIGNVNVNESRVMTFRGGNISLWSDLGNIEAGRGSRTAVSAEPPKLVEKSIGSKIVQVLEFTPPAVGSGIRAVTYDPDGIEGPLKAPEPGDIFLFAPKGVIDAGEAGIAGRNVTVVAVDVLNSKNISFSGASVGMSAGEGSVSLGSLSGVGNVTENSKMIEQNTGLGGQKDTMKAANKVEDFIASWLDVKVINFDSEPQADELEKKRMRTEG